jgi:predicted alpha/beta-hydrolase family hydrolase
LLDQEKCVLPELFRVEIAPSEYVTALEYPSAPENRAALRLILAHGAGANQTSPFIVAFATALAARGIETVTFNFAYSEHRRRIPDPNARLESCWRAVIETVRNRVGGGAAKLAIGGKSMGGRIASQIAGAEELAALLLLGYPLHPPGRPGRLRVAHLPNVNAPMLFVQGSRDAFGTPEELYPVLEPLRPRAELHVVVGGDHSFKVRKSAGVRQQDVYAGIQERIAAWLRGIVPREIGREADPDSRLD